MLRHPGIEKRLHPRIDQKLPFQVAVNGYDFTTATQNISCSGAYCRLKKYVPPFTKVAVKMTFPIKTHNKVEQYNVECQGVIVRTDDKGKEGFNIAIFFNEIGDSQRKKISQYVNQFLPKESASLSGR